MVDRDHSVFYQYRRNRRKFAFRVYLIAAVFSIITITQWGVFLYLDNIRISDIFVEHYYISIITLLAALFIVTLFALFEGLRLTMPLNLLASILIVEFVTIGLARIVVVTSIENFAYGLAVAGIVTVLFIVLGIFVPRDLTLHVIIVFLCAFVFFVGSVFFAMLAIIADIHYSIMVYCGFVIAIVLMFLMFHAQTINGGRHSEMRLSDFLLAALIIYHDFVILYILSMFIATAIAGENQLFNLHHPNSICRSCDKGTNIGYAKKIENANIKAVYAGRVSAPAAPPTSLAAKDKDKQLNN